MPVDSLSDVKALKQDLNRLHGLPPRFRQKLFFRGTPLDDSARLDSPDSPTELDVVLLSYSLSSQDQAHELLTVFANGSMSEARPDRERTPIYTASSTLNLESPKFSRAQGLNS